MTRTKEQQVEAILKRTKEVFENADYLQSFTIIIRGGVDEVTGISYDITEAVNDWSDEE